MEAVTPKAYLCADFIACEGGKSYDVISGGSNGSVYLWRAGCLTATAVVCRGPLTCLQIIGTRVICGGAGGVVKVLDGRTLTSIRVFNVTGVATQDLNSSFGGRLSSGTMPSRSQSRGSSSSRAKSAGYSSTGSRPDTIKSTALTADNLIADASITSLTVCEDRRSAKGVRLSAVASTAAGVTLRIDIEDDEGVIDAILYCHSGAVNGVARWGSSHSVSN